MKKSNYLLILSALMLCSPVIAQEGIKKTVYSIKPSKAFDITGKPILDKEGKAKFELKAEDAIKALCGFAKIQSYSIDNEVMELPGKYINLSNTDLSILTEMVLRSFGLEINKIVFENGTAFYEFRKSSKKIVVPDLKK